MALRHLILVPLLLAGCADNPPPAGSLEDTLRSFEGRFDWNAARQDYFFSEAPRLGALLDPASEETLKILADCIDDPRPATATLDGAAVSLGVMCYQALRQSAYVETPDWPGHIGPLATPEARHAAKRAWQAAIAGHLYVLH